MAAKGGVIPKSENGWWRSIRVKAILIILIMVVPLVLVGAMSILYYQGVVRQNISNDALDTAMTVSTFTPTYIQASQLYLKSVADRPSVIKAIGDNDRSFLHSMAVYTNDANQINSVYFADRNGVVIESTPELSGLVGTNASVHPYVSSVLNTGEPSIGDAVPGYNGLPVVPIVQPINGDNGTVIGVLVGIIDLGEFEKVLSGTIVAGQRQIYLVNRTGHVIAHTNPVYMSGMTDFSSVSAVQHALHGETGAGEYYNNVYNETVLGAYAPIQPQGWGVVVSSPVSVAYQPVWNTTWPMIALFALFTLLAVGLGLLFGNSIVAPITSLSQATKSAFKNEDYKRLLPLSRRDEIGDLSRSFDDMVETVKRTEGKLQDSLENFSALANNIPQLAWMARADGHIFWYNKQWYDYTGTTLEEMQGWGWQKIHHPDYVKRITEKWQHSLETGTPFDDVFPLRGKDGKYHWFLTRVTPVRDEQGKLVRWFGTNTDITERKRDEDALVASRNEAETARQTAVEESRRAELYMDIMGHDINNLNQVTLGYLEMIKDDSNLTDDQREMIMDALNASRGSTSIIDNVRKIQRISEEKGALQPEDINDMILECIRSAPKQNGRKITLNYTPRKGLIIMGTALMREVFCNLINNAVKHSPGDVVVDIRVDEDMRGDKKFYEVSVADNGPGIPDDVKSRLFNRFQRGQTKTHGKGLGLFIAKSLLEQAGGDVKVEDRVPGDYSKGAKFIVSLPVCEECK